MKGFILAAGFGKRLRPLTDDIPKSLIPVLNLPSICYALFLLKEAGISDVICNLHYRHRDVIEFFERNRFFDLNITFSTEDSILGTGGGVKNCESIIGDSDFILINSDIIMDIDLRGLVEYHEERSAPATIVLYRSERAEDIGSVGVEGDLVVDFKNFLSKNIASDLVYTGLAVLSPEIFKYLTKEFSSIVYTGYIGLIENRFISYYEHKKLWQDIGDINSFWKANIPIMSEIPGIKDRMSSALGIMPQIVSDDSVIDESASIKNSVIGKGAVIGENSVIEGSVMMPGSVVADNCTVINSVVYRDRVIEVMYR